MKPSPSSEHDEKDQKIIKLFEDLRSFDSEYPADLLTARRAAFLAQMEQLNPVDMGEELSAREQETVKLLENLKAVQVQYPSELLAARRAAFLAQVEGLSPVEISDELSAGEQEIVNLLGNLKSAPVEYPPELLAARRSAFLRQAVGAGSTSLWDQLRLSIKRIFPYTRTTPTTPATGFTRLSLVIASLLLAVLIGSLLFSRTEPLLSPSPSEAVVPTQFLTTSPGEVGLTICQPEDPTPSCPPGELTPDQDLADPGNGTARPAVSKDARSGDSGVHRASYVNDGRGGESWVSNSPNSWIKIDLGQVTTINTVSLQKGSPGSSDNNHLGQFVIAVALSDVYSDGNSSNDFVEYAQVFSSAEAGFSGTVSSTETIRTSFPSTPARFVKITFEQAGAAIEQVGVFRVPTIVSGEQVTSTPQVELPTITLSSSPTNIALPTSFATSVSIGTPLPTHTAILLATDTLPPAASSTPDLLPTSTRTPSRTPTAVPSSTGRPTNTSTPVFTAPLPSDTPVRLPTLVPTTSIPPTAIPPTAVPPTVQPPPIGSDPIVVTGNDQTLTFTCNGNSAVIRGHANIVTLMGTCSSITVTGNGNLVFYQSGSPVIIDQGKDNIITQR